MKWIGLVPLPDTLGGAFGSALVGDYLYLTSQRGLAIFDVSQPSAPRLTGRLALPAVVEFREAPATNGKILLTRSGADSGWHGDLLVVDVRDKSEPRILSRVPGALDHNYVCLFDCRWAYGAHFGWIIDLTQPRRPKLLQRRWSDGLKFTRAPLLGDPQNESIGGTHSLTEVGPGIVLTASTPMYLLDARRPDRPKVIARSDGSPYSFGSAKWPSWRANRIAMSASYSYLTGRCELKDQGLGNTFDTGFKTWDTSGWKKTGLLTGIDTYFLRNGAYADGDPAVSGSVPLLWGCISVHFDIHPAFRQDGLVALASSAHGLKLLMISKNGRIAEKGYFLADGAASTAATWVSDRIVYAIDAHRGIDILRYEGRL